MLYVRRKFKSVTIYLRQYIHILFVLNFIFESLFVPDIVPIDIVGFFLKKTNYVQVSLKHILFCSMSKQKLKSENTIANYVQKYTFNKKQPNNLQEMYAVQI